MNVEVGQFGVKEFSEPANKPLKSELLNRKDNEQVLDDSSADCHYIM